MVIPVVAAPKKGFLSSLAGLNIHSFAGLTEIFPLALKKMNVDKPRYTAFPFVTIL